MRHLWDPENRDPDQSRTGLSYRSNSQLIVLPLDGCRVYYIVHVCMYVPLCTEQRLNKKVVHEGTTITMMKRTMIKWEYKEDSLVQLWLRWIKKEENLISLILPQISNSSWDIPIHLSTTQTYTMGIKFWFGGVFFCPMGESNLTLVHYPNY